MAFLFGVNRDKKITLLSIFPLFVRPLVEHGSRLLSKEKGGEIMQVTTQAIQSVPSKKRLLAGRIISGLAVLFLLFDAIAKLMRASAVLEACDRLGIPQSLVVEIGSVLLACVVVYVIPRTSVLGAVLLTGYLGGAVATHLRAGSPVFDTVFPIIFGTLIWAGIFMREGRLRMVLPLRD